MFIRTYVHSPRSGFIVKKSQERENDTERNRARETETERQCKKERQTDRMK